MTAYFGIIIEYQLKVYTIRPRFRETPFQQPKYTEYNRFHMSMPNRGKREKESLHNVYIHVHSNVHGLVCAASIHSTAKNSRTICNLRRRAPR